jgi:hypothetical protein
MTALTLVDRYHGLIINKYPELAKLHVLISYNYVKDQIPVLVRLKQEGKIASSFLDAGTYAMNPDGKNPGRHDQFDVYLAWILHVGEHFDFISSFDDRFNEPEHNRLNYDRLRTELGRYDAEHGTEILAKLVPVIHSPETGVGDDFTPAQEFRSYLEKGARTIGIGSKPMIREGGMKEITELTQEFNARIHRFGNFGFKFLAKWKIASADSGRYFRSAMNGKEAWFWDSQKNKPVCWDLRSKILMPEEYADTLDRVFGWDVDDLLDEVVNIWMVNIFSHQQAQQYLTEKFAI